MLGGGSKAQGSDDWDDVGVVGTGFVLDLYCSGYLKGYAYKLKDRRPADGPWLRRVRLAFTYTEPTADM